MRGCWPSRSPKNGIRNGSTICTAPLAQIVGTGSSTGRGAPPEACESKKGSHNPMCCPFAVTVGNGCSIERVGVCRDFQHLAITFCRCMHIPARYATGYLGDIGVPASPAPMDFSAWFEAYLEGRWWTFDARHNEPRVGRVLMATGRDAADVAITTSFGMAELTKFSVVTNEVCEVTSFFQGLCSYAAGSGGF